MSTSGSAKRFFNQVEVGKVRMWDLLDQTPQAKPPNLKELIRILEPADNVVLLSNGGFGGLPAKLVARLSV